MDGWDVNSWIGIIQILTGLIGLFLGVALEAKFKIVNITKKFFRISEIDQAESVGSSLKIAEVLNDESTLIAHSVDLRSAQIGTAYFGYKVEDGRTALESSPVEQVARPNHENLIEASVADLNHARNTICEKTLEIMRIYGSPIPDLRKKYIDAVQSLSRKECLSAARDFYQIFNTVLLRIQPIAGRIEISESKLKTSQLLVNGLEQMLTGTNGDEELEKQISDCENAILLMLINMPL